MKRRQFFGCASAVGLTLAGHGIAEAGRRRCRPRFFRRSCNCPRCCATTSQACAISQPSSQTLTEGLGCDFYFGNWYGGFPRNPYSDTARSSTSMADCEGAGNDASVETSGLTVEMSVQSGGVHRSGRNCQHESRATTICEARSCESGRHRVYFGTYFEQLALDGSWDLLKPRGYSVGFKQVAQLLIHVQKQVDGDWETVGEKAIELFNRDKDYGDERTVQDSGNIGGPDDVSRLCHDQWTTDIENGQRIRGISQIIVRTTSDGTFRTLSLPLTLTAVAEKSRIHIR